MMLFGIFPFFLNSPSNYSTIKHNPMNFFDMFLMKFSRKISDEIDHSLFEILVYKCKYFFVDRSRLCMDTDNYYPETGFINMFSELLR